jgi:hypothetical protein
MIIKITLEVEDLNHGIDFIDAELEDFDIPYNYIQMAHVIEFVNDKGDVIKEFKNRFGGTK